MTTRRRFLAAGGSIAAGTLAGCLGLFGDDEETVDDEFLTSLADPSDQVPPKYFAGYQYKVGDIRGSLDPVETLPRIQSRISAGAIAEAIDGSIDGISLEEVDRFTGSTYRASPILGGIGVPVPGGEAVHVTGEFAADPLIEFFDGQDPFERLDESDGYERFVNERDQIDRFTAFGVTEGRLIAVERSDLTVDTGVEEALATEFDQVGADSAPILDVAPGFAAAVQALDAGSIRAGAGYAFVPLGADTGTAEFDEVVRGVRGAGVRVELGDQADLHRSVEYLDAEMASESTVSDAYSASESETLSHDGWSFSADGTTVMAERTDDEIPPQEALKTSLPVPGYGSVFELATPSDLGRSPPPQVFFQASLDDGTLVITHAGGSELESLRVRYVSDGEVRQESWSGPVRPDDEYQSQETVDSDTLAWVVWQPDTVDAAVVGRFQT